MEQPDSNNTTLIVSACVIVGVTTSYLLTRNRKKKPWPAVKGALPIIGNLHQVKSPGNLSNKMKEWADEYSKEKGCFEVDLAGTKYVAVCSEERMKEILKHRPFKIVRDKKSTHATKSVGADGIFGAEHQQWKNDRRLLAPSFNHAQIRDYLPHIRLVLGRLLHKWKTNCMVDGKVVPFAINDDLSCYAMDTTALTTLGQDFDTLSSEGEKVMDAENILTILQGVITRTLSPIAYWQIPIIGQHLDGIGSRVAKLKKSIESIVDAVEVEGGSNTLVKKVVSECKTSDTSKSDRDRIMGHLLTMFFAGTDSSMSTTCSVLQKLCEDETNLQNELLEEVRKNLPEDLSTVTLEDLSADNLPKMKSFLCEVHRYYGAFPMLMLHAEVDIPFCGTVLPKGTQIMTMNRYVGINPYCKPKDIPLGPNGESVTEFCPRRFLKLDEQGQVMGVELPPRTSTSFLSFGHGRRVCLGRAFSEAVLLYTLASLLKTFEMKLAPDHEPIGRELTLAEVPDIDVRIAFKPRERNTA